MINLLIMDLLAEDYKKALVGKFPNISISTVQTTETHAIPNEKEAETLIKNADILFVTIISEEMIRNASRLKWIQCRTSGVDKLLELSSLDKDVLITSTHGIHGPQMSELTLLLMLALNRNLPKIIRNQDQRVWDRWSPKLLYRKKAGILGMGVCGIEIARKCKAFGMTVYGIARTKREIDGVDYFHTPDQLLDVVREVDYFVVVAPFTSATKNMIDERVLSCMKPTAYLINVGRGEIIDEKALINALKTGKIAGAALDAFCMEPLPADNPLWGMENVIITPHVGGLREDLVEQILLIFEENIRRFIRGEGQNLVNLVQR